MCSHLLNTQALWKKTLGGANEQYQRNAEQLSPVPRAVFILAANIILENGLRPEK